MNEKILIVEDEKAIADIVEFNLQREGFQTVAAYEGRTGLEMALNNAPDLILLDVMLPLMDGFDVCREVRRKSNVPIIMLTAREEESDKVFGLEIGADDYITKPFSMKELIARVKANVRRHTMFAAPPTGGSDLKFGALILNREQHVAKKNGELLELSAREFDLLCYLAAEPERIFSREELMQEVWGYEYYGDLRAVDVAVRRLREKIEDDPAQPEYIVTKRGAGYYFGKIRSR